MCKLSAMFLSLACSVLLAAPAGFSAAPSLGRYTFQTYGQEEGLDSMGISALVQDTQGFLWVGTDLGAYRYDGWRFHRVGAKEGLAPAPATRLWADPRGGIWASNREGTFRVHGDRAEQVKAGLAPGAVLAMAWDAGGRMWAAMGNQGLFRELPGGGFEKVPCFPNPVAVAAAPRHGGLFLASDQGRAELWKPDGSVRAWGALQGVPGAVEGLREDAEGRVWLLSRQGLWFKRLEDAAFRSFDHPAAAAGGDARDLTEDGKGGLWVATVHGLLHLQGRRWTLLTDREGMPTKAGGQVLVDREGSLWYAGSGLHRQMGLGAISNQTTRDGLPTELVWALCRDGKGRLWAGTNLGLALQAGERWLPVPGSEHTALFSVVPLANGGILAAGRPRTLLYVAPGAARAVPVPVPLDQDLTVSVLRLFLDQGGSPWVVGTRQCARLELKGGSLAPAETRTAPEPRFFQNAYTSLQTRDGRLWFASANGLVTCQEGRWRRYLEADGLEHHGIYGLLEARDGTLLVSYYGDLGISRFALEGDRLRLLRTYRAERNELPSNSVFSLHQDLQGRLWALTNVGAALVKEDGYQVFGQSQGLLQQDMVQNTFLSDPDGTLWFANAEGLVRFDSKAWPWALPVPAPLFQAVQFSGKAQPPGAPLVAAPRENSLGLSLGFLSYARGRDYTFQVRVDGLDRTWRNEPLSRLQYLSLPHGAYVLRARALVDGAPGPESDLEFRILPHWYQTWWFRSALLAALVLAPFGLAVVRQRRLRKANALLEATVAERTRELAEANAKLEAQSVTDPLTGLKNRRFLALFLPNRLALLARALSARQHKPPGAPLTDLHPLAFLILDLDLFKRVNDDHGHAAGDAVIQQMARLLLGLVRDTDSVIRWGGEEFLIVAQQTGSLDPAILPERIRAAVEAHPFVLPDGQAIHKTVSIGVVPYPLGTALPMLPWETAVNLADRALYAVKRSGRNGWICLQEGPAFSQEDLAAFPATDVPAHLAEGTLEVRTSLGAIASESWI